MCAALQPGNFSAGVVIRGTIQEPGAILGVGIAGTVFYTLYCYRQHSSAQDFRVWYCYRAHSLRKMLLLFTAQFAGASGRIFAKSIVIQRTIRKNSRAFGGCYRRHISVAGPKSRLLCTAHFQKFCRLFPCCYLQHIFWVGVVIQRTVYSMYNFIFAATGVVIHGTFCKKSLLSVPFQLLFTAQFPQKFLLGLLFSAQFRKNSAFAGQIVSLDTISRIFAGCCYSQHNLIF